MKFKLNGCKVSINFYFFAIAAVISIFDRNGMILGGLFSALLHESGHLAAMMIIPNQKPVEIKITPFGMRIVNNPDSEFMRGRIFVLAAGSTVNLILAAALMPYLPRIASMNFVMGTMNMLPIDTMDGGGILNNLLCRKFSEKASEYILTAISIIFLTLLAFVGVYILFRTKYNFTLLTMALWMLASILMRLTKK